MCFFQILALNLFVSSHRASSRGNSFVVFFVFDLANPGTGFVFYFTELVTGVIQKVAQLKDVVK